MCEASVKSHNATQRLRKLLSVFHFKRNTQAKYEMDKVALYCFGHFLQVFRTKLEIFCLM